MTYNVGNVGIHAIVKISKKGLQEEIKDKNSDDLKQLKQVY